MSKHKVTFVYSDDGDWIGMYIDNQWMAEGHSIQERDVVAHLITALDLDVEIESRWDWNVDADAGRLPNQLSEVTFDE